MNPIKIMKTTIKSSRCQVPGCSKNPNASIHVLPSEIPRNEEKRKKWIEALYLKPDVDGTVYVCGDHFTANDFMEGIS